MAERTYPLPVLSGDRKPWWKSTPRLLSIVGLSFVFWVYLILEELLASAVDFHKKEALRNYLHRKLSYRTNFVMELAKVRYHE